MMDPPRSFILGSRSYQFADYLPHADGFIVGTAFKKDGVTGNPVDADRVRALMTRLGAMG